MRPFALLSHLVCIWLHFQVCFECDTLCLHASACMYLRHWEAMNWWGCILCREMRNVNGFWKMNDSLLLYDTKGFNVRRQDFFCAITSFLIKARQKFQIYLWMYKWQNVRMKILAFEFNRITLFGLNCLKGKKKGTSVSILTLKAFMYIWEDALYIKILW